MTPRHPSEEVESSSDTSEARKTSENENSEDGETREGSGADG